MPANFQTLTQIIESSPSPSAQPSATAAASTGDGGDQATCAAGTSGSIDYAAGAQGPKSAVLAVAAHQLKGLQPSDRVELIGTAANGMVTVRVLRDGMTAAVGILRV